jgi:predicted CxxxxCH...CXXCH cytochrome family protein
VPEQTLAPGHVDSTLPAEVRFSGVALSFSATPEYENGSCQGSFCHTASIAGRDAGGTGQNPVWTQVDGTFDQCTSCHAMPPPAPHPVDAADCSNCHHNVATDRTFVVPGRHVDGIVTFFLTPQGQ